MRYRELERKVVGITATMLTKCLRELEKDKFIIPALESVYKWAEDQMK